MRGSKAWLYRLLGFKTGGLYTVDGKIGRVVAFRANEPGCFKCAALEKRVQELEDELRIIREEE